MAPVWTASAKEGHAIRPDAGKDVGIDGLGVHVADATGVLCDEGAVVGAGEGDVPGVQAERDRVGVGDLQETLNPLRVST